MASSSSEIPVQIQNQRKADALVAPHKLNDGTTLLPIAKIDAYSRNRELDLQAVADLAVSFKERIDVNRATCQVVFFPKDGMIETVAQAKAAWKELCEQNADAVDQPNIDWIEDKFEVKITGGQHRAKVLRNWGGANLDIMWPTEIYFKTVLDNLDARFELIHAKNTHSAALPTSLKHYLVELRRRIDADVETHSNKPDWLAGLKPNGREVAVWTKTLDTWTPSSPAADHTKTKAELVKLFVSSRALSEVLIEMAGYPAWDAATSSFANLRDWMKFSAGDISAVSMNLGKEAFKLLFGHAPRLLTRVVATRLSGHPLPTTDAKLEDMRQTIGNQIDKKKDWPAIKTAAEQHRPRLMELAAEHANFVGPAHILPQLKLRDLAKRVFIPLAISLDEDNAKAYGTGSGSTTKFPVPLTTMIAREIWNFKGPGADRQKIDDAIKAFVLEIVKNHVSVRDAVKDQPEKEALVSSSLMPDSILVKALERLLSVVGVRGSVEKFVGVPLGQAEKAPNAPGPSSAPVDAPGDPSASAASHKGKKRESTTDAVEQPPQKKEKASHKLERPIKEELDASMDGLPPTTEEVLAKIQAPEVADAAYKIYGNAVASAIYKVSQQLSLFGFPAENLQKLCAALGGRAGMGMIDEAVLGRLVSVGGDSFLKALSAYEPTASDDVPMFELPDVGQVGGSDASSNSEDGSGKSTQKGTPSRETSVEPNPEVAHPASGSDHLDHPSPSTSANGGNQSPKEQDKTEPARGTRQSSPSGPGAAGPSSQSRYGLRERSGMSIGSGQSANSKSPAKKF